MYALGSFYKQFAKAQAWMKVLSILLCLKRKGNNLRIKVVHIQYISNVEKENVKEIVKLMKKQNDANQHKIK